MLWNPLCFRSGCGTSGRLLHLPLRVWFFLWKAATVAAVPQFVQRIKWAKKALSPGEGVSRGGRLPPFPCPKRTEASPAVRSRLAVSAAPLGPTRGRTRGKGHRRGSADHQPVGIRVSVRPHSLRGEARAPGRRVRALPPPHPEASGLGGFEELGPAQRSPHLLRMMTSPTMKARAAKIRPPLRTVS